MARDLYSRLDEVDELTLRTIAGILELRGRHPQQQAIRAAYLDALGDLGGLAVLEVGCGTGVVTRDLAARVGPGGTVVGIDPTPVFIDAAREQAELAGSRPHEYLVQEQRTVLPFAAASFDRVAAVTVLCHVPEREALLGEMARVLKPGGRLLLVDGEYAANQIEHPDRTLTARLVDAWRASVVDDPYLMRRIVPFVEAAGLRVQAVNAHTHVETGRVDEATSFIWQWAQFAARQAVGAGAISEAEAASWIARLSYLHRDGLLFGSVTYVSVVAEQP